MAVATITVRTRATRQQVLATVRSLPRLLAGRQHHFQPPVQAAMARVGLAAQQFIYEAFRQKSLGLSDAAGLRWKQLAPLTIRLKRRTAPANARRVLREFDDLLMSLKPPLRPQDAVPLPPLRRYQVFQVRPGRVTIGTNRPHAALHHRGVPGKLPQRRLWPKIGQWPAAWWGRLVRQLRAGAIDVLRTLWSHAA